MLGLKGSLDEWSKPKVCKGKMLSQTDTKRAT